MTNVTQGFISIGGGSSVSGDTAPPPPPDLGAANFRKDIDLGLSQQTTLVMNTPPEQGLGLSIEQAPATLLTNQTLGLSVDTFSSGTAKPDQNLGLTQGSVVTMNNLPEKSAGFSIEQTWSYTGTKNVATASNLGPDNWTNVTNAQGAPNNVFATRSGQALSSTDASIRCQFQAVGTKDPLTRTKVELRFYVEQSGTSLGNGGLSVEWRIGSSGGWTNLATYTGDVDFAPAFVAFDITGSVATWQNVRDIEARVRANLALGTALVTCRCDAVILHIEANLTE